MFCGLLSFAVANALDGGRLYLIPSAVGRLLGSISLLPLSGGGGGPLTSIGSPGFNSDFYLLLKVKTSLPISKNPSAGISLTNRS